MLTVAQIIQVQYSSIITDCLVEYWRFDIIDKWCWNWFDDDTRSSCPARECRCGKWIKTKNSFIWNFFKVELEVQQVSGGTVTLPADVLNGGGLSGSREGSKTDSKSSKSEKSKKKSKEKRRSSSEDYYHKNHHSNNRDKSNDRRYHSKYNSKYDSRYDDSKYNDPYVSQKSTHV